MNLKPLQSLFKYFGRFSIVGATTTILYFILSNLLIHFKVASPMICSSGVYGMLVIVSFLGHSKFTFFNVGRQNTNQFTKFLILSVCGIVISNLIIFVSSDLLLLQPFISILLVTMTIPFLNFFLIKFWVFSLK